jgi:hypothetical protein
MPPLQNGDEQQQPVENKAVREQDAQTEKPAAQETPPAGKPAKADPFGDAFKAAQAELGDGPAPKAKEPAKKPAKAEADDEPKAKPAKAEKADEKPAKEPAKKAAKPAEDDDDGDDEPDPETPAPKKAEPLKPKRSWSARRQEDFRYLDPETQAAWLAEPTPAPSNWTAEEKEAFGRISDEALRDEYVAQRKSLERGFQEKFTALAAERKTLEAIKTSVPDNVRAEMQRRGLGEADVFRALVGEQQKSMNDPTGYVADFIRRNAVDLNNLAERLQGSGKAMQPAQADVQKHPAFQAMKSELDQLKGLVESQFQKESEESSREVETAFKDAVSARDERGALRYPYIRVLSNYMADLLEQDPETFEGRSASDRLDLAYRTAVDAHPELKAASRAAKPASADVQDDEEAEPAEDARTAKLKAAQTRKPRAPQTTPAKGGGDAFSRAFSAASKQLGHA